MLIRFNKVELRALSEAGKKFKHDSGARKKGDTQK